MNDVTAITEERRMVGVKKYVTKSNKLITAKYKTSLLANKLMAIAFTRIDKNNTATLTPSEIRFVLGVEDDKNIYRKLKETAQTLSGNAITIEDGNGNFTTFSLVSQSIYENGVLKIIFNQAMAPYVSNLTGDYTQLEIATLVNFHRASTFRLYELLKKEVWRMKKTKETYCTVRYKLNELRAELGLINTDSPSLLNYMAKNSGKDVDWDYVVEHVMKKDEIQFASFSDFRKRVLEAAQEEMKENSDITFEFETEKGARGKVLSILFIISRNHVSDETKFHIREKARSLSAVSQGYSKFEDDLSSLDEEVSGREFIESYEEIRRFLKESGINNLKPFTVEYYERLLQLADHDTELIKNAITLSRTVPRIRNFYGWLMKAVEMRYMNNKPVEVVSTHNAPKNAQAEFVTRPSSEQQVSASAQDAPGVQMQTSDVQGSAAQTTAASENLSPETELYLREFWAYVVQEPLYQQMLDTLLMDEATFHSIYPTVQKKLEVYRNFKNKMTQREL